MACFEVQQALIIATLSTKPDRGLQSARRTAQK